VSTSNISHRGAVIVTLLIVVAISGVAIGYGIESTVPTTPRTTTTGSQAPYEVTLVIATNNVYNSTEGAQPAYFVLGPKGLESSANITLPANRLIRLVIVCYDDGNASLEVPNDNVVSGTANGTIFVASNANINSTEGPSGIQVNGGQSLSSVPVADVAHTFTIPSLNLNIPVPTSSTVVAYFTVTKAGTYLWFCETSCGDAPMSTVGWMRGSVVVQ
jgi:plastocyanin